MVAFLNETCNTWAEENSFLKQDMYTSETFAILNLLFICFLLFLGYQVFRIVHFKDKIILSMIFFLIMEVLMNAAFFFKGALQDYEFRCKHNMAEKNYLYFTDKAVGALMGLQILFLIVAIIINLRNWVFYFIKIGEMAYH